jgi:hypothetical protein
VVINNVDALNAIFVALREMKRYVPDAAAGV